LKEDKISHVLEEKVPVIATAEAITAAISREDILERRAAGRDNN